MYTLNLSKDFYFPSENPIDYEAFIFNGGEPHIKLTLTKTDRLSEDVLIIQRICNSDDFLLLLLATDALKRAGFQKISVLLPYFPAARQDRVMVPGEALSLKIYTQLINQQQYERVIIFDPHSAVTEALLDRVEVISNHGFINQVLQRLNDPNIYLVAPDAGATKKIYQLAQQLNIQNVITCEKTRNLNTGQLSEFKIHADDLSGKTCLIVDDICDGGRTFMGIAEALKKKNAQKVYLAVSHGIFSDGLIKFDQLLDQIFTTDGFRNVTSDQVEVILFHQFFNSTVIRQK